MQIINKTIYEIRQYRETIHKKTVRNFHEENGKNPTHVA